MSKMVLFAGWSTLMLSLYGGAAAYGYSPFGDGQNLGRGGGGVGGVFIGGVRSRPVHK